MWVKCAVKETTCSKVIYMMRKRPKKPLMMMDGYILGILVDGLRWVKSQQKLQFIFTSKLLDS